MRSLLIAPAEDDVRILRTALAEAGLEPVASQSIGAGAALATVLTDDIVAAVAVLPPSVTGYAAVLVEIGIALGRGLPLLVVVPPGSELPAPLLGVRTVIADVDNREALRFQLRMFVQSLDAPRPAIAPEPPAAKPLSSQVAGALRDRLADIGRAETPQLRSTAFESWIVDVLRASGATVEQDRRYSVDPGVDAVVSLPGEEHRLGPLLVEAKIFNGPVHLKSASRQLVSQVLARGAGLGLLVYESPAPDPNPETTPRILQLWATDLISQLERVSLAEVLVRARNEAIHRL